MRWGLLHAFFRRLSKNQRNKSIQGNPMNTLSKKLMLGGSSLALLIAGPLVSQALAQPAGPSEVEAVTVTGTSIRGAAPVGSNVITVDQEAIRATGAVNSEQLLNTVTAIST